MKQVAVKVAGNEAEPLDIQIQPGQTAGEILNQLGLSGYILSFPNSNRFFGNEEPIYASVVDGEGTHLRRDTVIPQWFQASKAAAASDGHAVHCWVTAVICQLSRLKRIPDGDKLVATTPAQVGVIRPDFIGV